MKNYLEDPTAEKWDQIPLTRKEMRKVYLECFIWGAITMIIAIILTYII
jgi:hypothetical protein